MRWLYVVMALLCVAGSVSALYAEPDRLAAVAWPLITLLWVAIAYLWEMHPNGPWWRR